MPPSRQKAQSFRDLVVWQRARLLVRSGYELTARFPIDERFGITGQIRRAAISVSVNIAEGWGRGSRGELHHVVSIALGSLHELDALIDLAIDVGHLSDGAVGPIRENIADVGRMLTGLRRAVAARKEAST